MKLNELFESDWGVPKISTKTFTTGDGVKLKLTLYGANNNGSPVAIGLELENVASGDVLHNDEVGHGTFPTEFFYSKGGGKSNVEHMRSLFREKIVPTFLNKPLEDMDRIFDAAISKIEFACKEEKEDILKDLLKMVKNLDDNKVTGYGQTQSLLNTIQRLAKISKWPELKTIEASVKKILVDFYK